MNVELIIGLGMSSIICVLCTVLSIVLLRGKGANLLSAYNSLSEEEKKAYDTDKMCKFMGKIMLVLAIASFFLAISYITNNNWFIIVFLVITILLTVFSLGVTSSARFKKA